MTALMRVAPGLARKRPLAHMRTVNRLLTDVCRNSVSPSRQADFLTIPASTRDRINEDAEGADIPRSLPRFDRPDTGTEKLLWIHVPYTHTGWVSQVIRRACQDRQEPTLYGMLCPRNSRHLLTYLMFSLRKFINDENWYLNLNRARHMEPHARFVRPKCIHSRQMDVSYGTKEGDAEDPQLALYVSAESPIFYIFPR
jgi:hypothetical protein